MAPLLWFEYSDESPDALFALAGTHRVDSIVVAFEQAIDQKAARAGEGALSVAERDVLVIEALEREVNNGGYHQFFLNSSREYAGEAVPALTRIGCHRTAAITQRALAALAPGTPLTPEGLEEEMLREDEARDAQLDACDQAYYAAEEDIAAALFAYLQANRDDLRFSS